MKHWIESLDRLLRGELTQLHVLRVSGLQIPLCGTTILIIVLGMIYGLCMGSFALLHMGGPRYMQTGASMVKVPALFLLTLLITFPSLYVFNALVGSSLRFLPNLRLLVGSLGVTLAVLSSLGPIIAFFSVSTTSYPFMKLLNVIAFAVSGGLGLSFLLQTLHRMSLLAVPTRTGWTVVDATPNVSSQTPSPDQAAGEVQAPASPEPPVAELIELRSPLDRTPGHLLGAHVKTVFYCWAIMFGLVGAQMGWVLRPFIGDPSKEFTWFRPRESNFFEAVGQTISSLTDFRSTQRP